MSNGFYCDPDEIRTHDPRLRRALLYPAELPDQSLLYFGKRCKSSSFFGKMQHFHLKMGKSAD